MELWLWLRLMSSVGDFTVYEDNYCQGDTGTTRTYGWPGYNYNSTKALLLVLDLGPEVHDPSRSFDN